MKPQLFLVKECTFTYDSLYYYFDDSPSAHVSLNDVDGLLFESNVFENTAPLNYAVDENRAIGISSWNSGIEIVKNPLSEIGNTFTGLNYGIKSFANILTNKLNIIDSADFNNNYTGCYFGAESFMSVTNCTFDATYNFEALDTYTGLYLDNCTGYQIEKNDFKACYSPLFPSTYKSVGLYINNSGEDDNIVYHNDFQNLLFATVAQNQNRSENGNYGLQYKCNTFTENYTDISVTWDDESIVHGIATSQGSKADTVIAPAGNLFSKVGNWSYSDFYNDGEDIDYHLPDGLSVYGNIRLRPDSITNPTIERTFCQSLLYWDYLQGCPLNSEKNSSSEIKSLISDNNESVEVISDSLTELIDGGSTTSLNITVATSTSIETMEVRGDLLDASPYLSDNVMLNAVEKEDVLPNSIITEVLTANPQSAKSGEIIDRLNERETPPSDYQFSLIMANDTIFGHKATLENKRDFYYAEKCKNVNNLIRLFLRDKPNSFIDSVYNTLSNFNNINSYYDQAYCSFKKYDTPQIGDILNNIPIDFELNSPPKSELFSIIKIH